MDTTFKVGDDVASFLAQNNTTEELVGGKPKTLQYRSWSHEAWYWQASKRPVFSWFAADLMILDPRVQFGMAIGNAPLLSGKITVDGPRKDVNDYVMEQWDRIWSNHASQLMRDKNYGHMPFEVEYRTVDRRIEFDTLRDLHPRDARPLLLNGRLRGIRVSSIQSNSRKTLTTKEQILRGMQGLWLTYDQRFNNLFGRALLLGAYAPWYEKNADGAGALALRVLRMVKDSWVGDVIYAPLDRVIKTPDGAEISAGSLARELQSLRQSGGAMVLPSNRDDQGNKYFEYAPPTSVQGATPILEWCDRLDYEIFDGLLVPREVVEAAETGSGFSGRSIPFLTFLALRDVEFGARLRQINEQILSKMVAMEWGLRAAQEYEAKPVPLLETVGEQMGDMGQPNTQSQSGGGGAMLQQLMQQRQQQNGGEGEDVQFATVEDEPRTRNRDKATTRRATIAGTALANDVRDRIDALLSKKKS